MSVDEKAFDPLQVVSGGGGGAHHDEHGSFSLGADPLQPPALVDHPLEEADDGDVVEGAGIGGLHPLEDQLLPPGLTRLLACCTSTRGKRSIYGRILGGGGDFRRR